jgi:hypothetical protein
VSAGVATAEGPISAPGRNTAQRALRCVVRHANAAIVEEAREGPPSLQAVDHRLRERVLRGELSAFLTQPLFEIVDERFGSLPTDGETMFGDKSVNLALDGQQLVEAAAADC